MCIISVKNSIIYTHLKKQVISQILANFIS